MYNEKAENGQSNNQKISLQIKQDDKFFNRLLSKESSSSLSNNPSFRVTPTVAIPFLWESHPGTPKHPFFSELSLPPLTPPPSYFYTTTTKKTTPSSNLFRFSFSKLNLKKTLFLNSSFSSSLSSSSTSSSSSSLDSSRTVGSSNGRRRRRFSSCGSSAYLWGGSKFEVEDEDDDAVVVGDSRRVHSSCFGFRRSSSFNDDGFGGCNGRRG